MGERLRAIGALMMIVLAIAAIGCGEDSTTGANVAETNQKREYPWVTGVAREFLVPGGDNLVQSYGEEGSAAEREEASNVIHAWMKARIAEDWGTDCSYISRAYRRNLVSDAHGVTNGRVTTCPGALEYFGDLASGYSGNTLTGPIDSLRVQGPEDAESEWEAWAQWHGPKGRDWVVPLERNGGVWKIASASPVQRLK
ncbi:MAG: hypothetical protein ACJ75T_11895 [Solirubrobacterales bacterium]